MPKDPSAIRLTRQSLEKLKEGGYRFVLVESYTVDRRPEHIELNHFLLKPVKELPLAGDWGIFEPIDSHILSEWADHPDNGIKAFIDPCSNPNYSTH
ncbi:MAG TPA: hypothetical protein VL978_06010 [Puia sp.]|nr:hypothetical protein [Puia sp.]